MRTSGTSTATSTATSATATSNALSRAVSTTGLTVLWRLAVAAVAIVGWWQSGHDLGLLGLAHTGALLLAVGYLALAAVDLVALLTGTGEPAHGLPRGALASVAAVLGIFYLTGLDGGADEVTALTTALLPLLVVIDWCFVGRSQNRMRFWFPAVWLVPVAAYLTAYTVTGGFPWQGEFGEPLYAAVLDPGGKDYPLQLVAFAIAAGFAVAFLYGLARMKAVGSASRYAAESDAAVGRRKGRAAQREPEEAGLSLFAPREPEPDVVPLDDPEPDPADEPAPEPVAGPAAGPVAGTEPAPNPRRPAQAPPWPLSPGVVPTASYAATPLPPGRTPTPPTARRPGPGDAGRHSESAGSGRHSEAGGTERAPWPPPRKPAGTSNGHRPVHRETPPSPAPAPDTRPWPPQRPQPAQGGQATGAGQNGAGQNGAGQNGAGQNGAAQNGAANGNPANGAANGRPTSPDASWWRPPTKNGERRQLTAPDGVPDNERPSTPPLRPDQSAPEPTREMPRTSQG